MPSPRRFPAPWTVEDLDTCYLVRDHDGQQLAYVYYEEESGRRSAAKCSRRMRQDGEPEEDWRWHWKDGGQSMKQ